MRLAGGEVGLLDRAQRLACHPVRRQYVRRLARPRLERAHAGEALAELRRIEFPAAMLRIGAGPSFVTLCRVGPCPRLVALPLRSGHLPRQLVRVVSASASLLVQRFDPGCLLTDTADELRPFRPRARRRFRSAVRSFPCGRQLRQLFAQRRDHLRLRGALLELGDPLRQLVVQSPLEPRKSCALGDVLLDCLLLRRERLDAQTQRRDALVNVDELSPRLAFLRGVVALDLRLYALEESGIAFVAAAAAGRCVECARQCVALPQRRLIDAAPLFDPDRAPQIDVEGFLEQLAGALVRLAAGEVLRLRPHDPQLGRRGLGLQPEALAVVERVRSRLDLDLDLGVGVAVDGEDVAYRGVGGVVEVLEDQVERLGERRLPGFVRALDHRDAGAEADLVRVAAAVVRDADAEYLHGSFPAAGASFRRARRKNNERASRATAASSPSPRAAASSSSQACRA